MAITQLQKVKVDSNSTPNPVATISASQVGSLIVVQAANDTGLVVNSIDDNKSNVYGLAVGTKGTQNAAEWELWYCANATAGVTTVNLHWSGNANQIISVEEYSGVKLSSPLDLTNSLPMTSGSPIGPSLTPSVAGELLVTSCICNDFFLTGVSAPWLLTQVATVFDGWAGAYYVNPPLSSQQAAFIPTTGVFQAGSLVASFLPQPAGGTSRLLPLMGMGA